MFKSKSSMKPPNGGMFPKFGFGGRFRRQDAMKRNAPVAQKASGRGMFPKGGFTSPFGFIRKNAKPAGKVALKTMSNDVQSQTKMDKQLSELSKTSQKVKMQISAFRGESNDAKFLNPMQSKHHNVFTQFIKESNALFNNNRSKMTVFRFYSHRTVTLQTLRYALILMNEYALFSTHHQSEVNQLLSIIRSIHRYVIISTNKTYFGNQVRQYHAITRGKTFLTSISPPQRTLLIRMLSKLENDKQVSRVGSFFINKNIIKKLIKQINAAPNFKAYRNSLGNPSTGTIPQAVRNTTKYDKKQFDKTSAKMQKALLSKYKKQGVPNPKHRTDRSQPKLVYNDASVRSFIQPMLHKSLGHYKQQLVNKSKPYVNQSAAKSKQFYKTQSDGKTLLKFDREKRRQNKRSSKVKATWKKAYKRSAKPSMVNK